MAIAPASFYDSFSRTTVDSLGTSDSGLAWQDTSAYTDTFGSFARITVPDYRDAQVIWINGPDNGTQEVLCKVKCSSNNSTDHGPVVRFMGTMERMFFVRINAGAGKLHIAANVLNGPQYADMAVTDFTFTAGVYYWIRFNCNTDLRVKVWQDLTAEPAGWNLTAAFGAWAVVGQFYANPFPPISGKFGYYTKGTDTNFSLYLKHFYWYSLEDTEPALPVVDNFERSVATGWGWSDTGHLWEGNFSVDPEVLTNPGDGLVQDPGDGAAQYSFVDANDRYGFLGPSQSGDVEALMKFQVNSTAGATQIRLGIHGTKTISAAAVFGHGYAAEVDSGGTVIRIRKKTTFNGAWTTLVTSAAITALLANQDYWIRFRLSGTTLSAKIWQDGVAEPGAFNTTVVDATITSGRLWVNLDQTDATGRTVKISSIQLAVFSATASQALTTGALTTNTVTDSSFNIQTTYANDTNTNSTCVLQYRAQGAETWTSPSVTTDRVGTKFTASATGLSAGTIYEVKATYSDANGVIGTNPLTTTVTTSLTGITTDELVLNPAATSIAVFAKYTDDTDNDSTATYQVRSLGTTSERIFDSFTAEPGTLLQNHIPEAGVGWIKDSSGFNNDLVLDEDGTLYQPAWGLAAYYYSAFVTASNDYDIVGTLRVKSLNDYASTGVFFRSDTALTNFYRVQLRANGSSGSNPVWTIEKVANPAPPAVLGLVSDPVVAGDVRNFRVTARGSVITLYVEGVPILSATDATHTTGRIGLFIDNEDFDDGKGIVFEEVHAYETSASGAYGGSTALTADRPNKQFTGTIPSLIADTTYEVKTTYADPDAVRGINPIIGTATTLGKGVAFINTSPITAEPSDVASVINAYYQLDTNNNSTITMQYRNIRDTIFTTISSGVIGVDRALKQFRTTITGLEPNQTYEVLITLADPDGVYTTLNSFGSAGSIVFTTAGDVVDPDFRGKQYLYKIYAPKDASGNSAYLGTWHDVPEPTFALHENGGVTDLTVSLPRRISDLNNDATVDHGNRIDVFAIDNSGDGMGPNFVLDTDFKLGSWVLDTGWTIDTKGGPDDGAALKFSSVSGLQKFALSENIPLTRSAPLVLTMMAKASGGKIRADMASYTASDVLLDTADDNVETIGTDWQELRLEWTPAGTAHTLDHLRVRISNIGSGTMYVDKVRLLPKELLIYRGRVESYTPKVSQQGEEVEIEVLGPIAQLSDSYIEFLQYVSVQPTSDVNEHPLQNKQPTDPANMMKKIIDIMQKDNPRCDVYYTSASIHLTGQNVEYTFRDQQVVACFDKIRNLCPPGWHWFIEPDGLVVLRGPEHAYTHYLRLNVEIMEYENERSIRNLKNKIVVHGRKDSDNTEPDGFGSIIHVAMDQASIDKYGLRTLPIRDANIKDPATAEIVGEGRLEEFNKVEENGKATIPDEKDLRYTESTLRGYNIESFKPGDFLSVKDPISGGQRTYWNKARWDVDTWDDNQSRVIPQDVPIKTINYNGNNVVIELSERQPSATGEFAKMAGWLRRQENETSN